MTSTGTGHEGLRDFRALYRAHYGFVWHALHRFGTASATIDDAVQDVFVVAYRRRSDYRGPSPKPWLYGIARRVASNYRRSMRRRIRRDQALPEAMRRPAHGTTRESIEALDRYLAGLRVEDRELLVLSELEGMTGRELAEVTGRNVQTIYTRVRKLRGELHEQLGDLQPVRRSRPRATAQSWAVLLPALTEVALPVVSGAAGAATWGAWGTWGWISGGVVAAALAVAVVDPWHTEVASPAQPPGPPTAIAGPVEPVGARSDPHAPTPRPPIAPPEPAAPTHAVVASPVRADRDATPQRPSATRRRNADVAPGPHRGLAEETELLRQASDALRGGDAAAALQATTEHGRKFPASALSDVRTAVRIEALCELGKGAQARGEAAVFLRGHPGSPVADRIERSCASASYKPADPDKAGA